MSLTSTSTGQLYFNFSCKLDLALKYSTEFFRFQSSTIGIRYELKLSVAEALVIQLHELKKIIKPHLHLVFETDGVQNASGSYISIMLSESE